LNAAFKQASPFGRSRISGKVLTALPTSRLSLDPCQSDLRQLRANLICWRAVLRVDPSLTTSLVCREAPFYFEPFTLSPSFASKQINDSEAPMRKVHCMAEIAAEAAIGISPGAKNEIMHFAI
jgi:hypothetical protein